jgi:phosphoglycolate phosphatase-like HAD superfamily hydrolase
MDKTSTMTLVLWDVDHTLIENGGVSKEVYATAFEMLTGRAAVVPIETDGRTDPDIMRNLLAGHGLVYDDDERSRTVLVEALASKLEDLQLRGHPMPGAKAILELLPQEAGVLQTVLTGNIQANAVVKLAAFGLDKFIDFEIGGYGSDDPVRSNLVQVAQARACAKYPGQRFDRTNTVVVGDTPRDVRTGLEGGARVVAVATGGSTMDDLRTAGASVVLPNLIDTPATLTAILEGS